jgi:hypothetical protein
MSPTFRKKNKIQQRTCYASIRRTEILNRRGDMVLWVLQKKRKNYVKVSLKKIKTDKHMQIYLKTLQQKRNFALEDRWPINPHRIITQSKWANWTMCLPTSMAPASFYCAKCQLGRIWHSSVWMLLGLGGWESIYYCSILTLLVMIPEYTGTLLAYHLLKSLPSTALRSYFLAYIYS